MMRSFAHKAMVRQAGTIRKFKSVVARVRDKARMDKHNDNYGPEYSHLRDYKLRENPLCELCHRRLAVECHHRTPLANGGLNIYSNLVAVCHPCHLVQHEADGDIGI